MEEELEILDKVFQDFEVWLAGFAVLVSALSNLNVVSYALLQLAPSALLVEVVSNQERTNLLD